MSSKKEAAPAAENKTARTLTPGVVIGRAIQKMQEIDADEAEALEQSPTQIRALYQAKRDELLNSLEEKQRKVVIAAVAASRDDEDEGPSSE